MSRRARRGEIAENPTAGGLDFNPGENLKEGCVVNGTRGANIMKVRAAQMARV
jgi:hypothetical protein